MFKKIFWIVILLFVQTLLSLKSKDLCYNIQEECIGSFDLNRKYQVKCEKVKCNGKFSIQCGINKCAINKKDCDDYIQFAYSFSLRNIQISLSIIESINENRKKLSFHEKQGQKLKLFNQNIGQCPIIPYEWKPTDVCIKGLKCYEKIKILKGFGYNYYKKPTSCQCPNSHSFECGKISSKSICAASQISCNTLKDLKTHKFHAIENCRNHSIFY